MKVHVESLSAGDLVPFSSVSVHLRGDFLSGRGFLPGSKVGAIIFIIVVAVVACLRNN